ncbi:interleukin-2 receptor subunit beta [Solea solea]|uniref:interleukin-2 receptor subunit beta n=1 Tax=Solea solea TaxID=90069 RepID=UPI00272C093F|nr:interleukin-2 receptor subunit beta [Solea solea]
MSHTAVIAMETLWPFYVLVVLVPAHAAHSHKGSHGLFCVNDYVNKVSCTWNSTSVDPGVDCWINGTKRTWILENGTRRPKIITRVCKLKRQGTSPPGCTFVFEDEIFNFKEVSNISVNCNGKLMERLTKYRPLNHIKMNPPDVPSVIATANETCVSWRPGSPRSVYIETFDFQLQVKLKHQTWKEASIMSTQEEQLRIPAWQLKGHCQVRVRVKPSDKHSSHWSDWSQTTSWTGAGLDDEDWFMSSKSPVMWGVMLSVTLIVVMFIIYRTCVSKRRGSVKPLPNPSKYFPTLHPVHGGTLKKWLNPLSASDSFFMAQPCDHISPVEVCENWEVLPSTSPCSSSTIALLHTRSFPFAGTDSSRVVCDSSSSSCFSNMGYFMSSSGSVAQTEPSPAYFAYQEDFHSLHSGHTLHLTLCASITSSSSAYESLKREPQSPDSGFGIRQEDEEDNKDEENMSEEGEDVSDDHLQSPLLILPLHPASWVCPPSRAPAHLPSLTQICSEELDDSPVAAASGNCAAWPLADTMCRSSSMPAEPCKTGYLTLKELQTTFSNKSI